MSKQCPYLAGHGRHLYVPYRVTATGKTGEACHGCGIEREDTPLATTRKTRS